LPLSLTCQRALRLARELALQAGLAQFLSSEHLTLGLLQADPELARQLESFGLHPGRLEAELRAGVAPALHLDEPLHLSEPAELIDAARILDAAANRAREGLRVVEDYCRFALDDAFLSSELKQLRHDLTEALSPLPPPLLLEARETLQDVGTRIQTSQEPERHSLRDVALVNLKRLQEALRTLEEVSKLFDASLTPGGRSGWAGRADLGRTLEQLRYRSYTLERAILIGADGRQRLAGVRLYVLLTGANCKAALDWTVREAAAGGAGMFQLREKNLGDRELLERARLVRRWTREAGALFIVNDRPDIARLAEADGVHLGQDDLPVKEARRNMGPGLLVGVSTHNIGQLRQAVLDGASYVGIGPTFPSATKEFRGRAGLEYVRQALAETSLPAFVIGGVTLQNAGEAAAAGARRFAVSQAICGADDPRRAAAELVRQLTVSPDPKGSA
jgi:thiamine-phosphate pyrophosphorylase